MLLTGVLRCAFLIADRTNLEGGKEFAAVELNLSLNLFWQAIEGVRFRQGDRSREGLVSTKL
jgi:hypothetical protein